MNNYLAYITYFFLFVYHELIFETYLLFYSGSPINTFEFIMKPLFQSLDYGLPRQTLGVHPALLMARIFWVIYTLLYPWLNRRWLPQPLLLPAEVYKVSDT